MTPARRALLRSGQVLRINTETYRRQNDAQARAAARGSLAQDVLDAVEILRFATRTLKAIRRA